MGNLTRDPELKYTPSGVAVASFAMALNHKYKVGEEKREEVCFVEVTAWQKAAEIIGEYCSKGSLLYVESRARTEQWDDKTTGQKRSAIRFTLTDFQLLPQYTGRTVQDSEVPSDAGRISDRVDTHGDDAPPPRPRTPPVQRPPITPQARQPLVPKESDPLGMDPVEATDPLGMAAPPRRYDPMSTPLSEQDDIPF